MVARRLFARVLDAPGGINILTIHAFCQALLKRFPLEAGVAPGFEVLDEAEAQTILRRVQDEQMEALARSDAPPALAAALAAVAGQGLDRRIRRADDAAAERAGLAAGPCRRRGAASRNSATRLRRQLNCEARARRSTRPRCARRRGP